MTERDGREEQGSPRKNECEKGGEYMKSITGEKLNATIPNYKEVKRKSITKVKKETCC